MAVIHFSDLGNKNPIKDKDTIIWFLTQRANQYPRSHRTKYWLNIHEQYFKRLIQLEAFEVLEFIKAQTTVVQKKNRAKWRIAHADKSKKEMEYWRKHFDKQEVMNSLIKNISLN